MYDYRGKIGGAIIAFLAFIAIISERFWGIIFFRKLSNNQYLGLFEWVMLTGLFFIVFSKEKKNEQKAQKIRLKAFQIAFGVSISILLAIALCMSINPQLIIDSSDLFAIAATGILLYLLFFHFGLYFSSDWESENIGLWENIKNIKKNKAGIVAYFILCSISIVFLILLLLL